MIYISSDHGGFALKNYLIKTFKDKGVNLEDLGPKELNGGDDYPDFAISLATKVTEDPENKGILLCRNGIGMSIVANRFKGIRAALSWNTTHAKSSRNDDDSNVLTLPADYISEIEAVDIVESWLNTPFSGQERMQRRLEKINSL
jgi:ribose 5-phosphate isomerase B